MSERNWATGLPKTRAGLKGLRTGARAIDRIVHEEDHEGYHFALLYDEFPCNPRTDQENFCRIWCAPGAPVHGDGRGLSDWQRRHIAEAGATWQDDVRDAVMTEAQRAELDGIAERVAKGDPDLDDDDALAQALREWLERHPGEIASRPLFLFQHGLMKLETHRRCPWDSGQIGRVSVSRARLEYLGHPGPDVVACDKVIQAELEEYTHYLNGEVYHCAIWGPDGALIEDPQGDEELWGCCEAIDEARKRIERIKGSAG